MSFFSMVSLLIALAAVSRYVNYRYIKLPTTVGVMLVALVARKEVIVSRLVAIDGLAGVSHGCTPTRPAP